MSTACGTSDVPEEVVPPTDGGGQETEPDTQESGPQGLLCCSETEACPPGDFCLAGACHEYPLLGTCYSASECSVGQECVDALRCACDDPSCRPVTGLCRWPGDCCNKDSDCSSDDVCVEGVCLGAPSDEGRCYATSHCLSGQVCEGIDGCPCGIDGCTPEPGYCAIPGACCRVDAECGANGRCISEGCMALPETGRCYEDGDCAGDAVCAGAYHCPCGDVDCDIPTTSGTCQSGDACCVTNADCGAGSICVDGEACVPIPEENACYTHQHCGHGRVCDGAELCACGDDCPDGSTPGTCRTVAVPCQTDSGCAPGMRCVVPDQAWCPDEDAPNQGVCVEVVDAECWSTDDCSGQTRCAAERVCQDPAGCAEPNVPGDCRDPVLEGDCCDSHIECVAGHECRNSNTTKTCPPQSTAVCLPEPIYGETCWNYLDCPESYVCDEVRICACGARCFRNNNGFCSPAKGHNCQSDNDCGSNYTCARDYECVANPCFVNNDCSLGGTCHPAQEGSCWHPYECGDGNYCKGLRVCPANTTCLDPDKPGVCASQGDAGDCCDSYYGCGQGLRCVSVVGKSGCALDASAICVPYTQYNTHEDCEENRKCSGAQMCFCNDPECEGPPQAGACVFEQSP